MLAYSMKVRGPAQTYQTKPPEKFFQLNPSLYLWTKLTQTTRVVREARL